MSDRGSFVTEYIYCDRCLELAKTALLHNDKGVCSRQIPSWAGRNEMMPIIAGRLGSNSATEMLLEFEEMTEELHDQLCHPLRVAVMTEGGMHMKVIDKSRASFFDHPLDDSRVVSLDV